MNFTDYNRYIVDFSEEEVMEALMDYVKKQRPEQDFPVGSSVSLTLSSGLYYNANKSASLSWYEEKS